MTEPFGRLRRFLQELKRRKVYRVAAVYAAVAFVILQVANLVFPALNIPSWAYSLVVVLALLGFPLALVLAWAFEVTPEGVRRTPEPEPAEEGGTEAGRGLSTGYKILVGLGLVAAAVAGGWYLTGGGGGETPKISDRSVAVLPFEALGEDEPGTFTEGMHSDLQTKLSNVAGLTVTSSRSVEQYRGSDKSTEAVAQELGVGWIVTGDVQQAGDRIQVTVRLVDPETDTQAWTDSYRRDLTAEDLFAIQTDITREVARALQAELSPEETDRVEREPTQSLEAHRLYAQGRRLILSRRPDSLRRAIDRFERAIEQDSSYALAWAGLADARILHAEYSSGSVETRGGVRPEAEAAARRALELDPNLAEAHASLGLIYFIEHLIEPEAGRTGSALRHLQRAVKLKPSYAEAHYWLGLWLMKVLRLDAALDHLKLGVELNPRDFAVRRDLIGALIARRRYKEALSEARRLQDLYPRREEGPALEAAALVHLKRWNEVRRVARSYRTQAGESPRWVITYLALSAVARGETASARSSLKQLRRRENGQESFPVAIVEAALGNVQAAEAAVPDDRRNSDFLIPRVDGQIRYWYPGLLESVRDGPAYQELIRKLNRKWGLNPDGSLPDSVDVSFDSETSE